ncbi:DUF2628 domain-containing protein [Evansella sp. AB-rgal1]|uniref:DUF2628 domain-containing protein n=1 Tax=Evansella sp. AB-rgal1 TaxID=3242696 RepID=UPI00359D0E21
MIPKNIKNLVNDKEFKNDVIDFVESNSTYYINKWTSHKSPMSFSGWNWVSFLFTPFWLAYRNMYFHVLTYFFVITLSIILYSVLPIITYFTFLPNISMLGFLVIPILHIIYGYKGNAYYATFVTRNLGNKAEDGKPRVPLFNRSGRSLTSAFLVPFTVLIIFIVPAYHIGNWIDGSSLPSGVYVYPNEQGPPQSYQELLKQEEIPTFIKYSESIDFLYRGEDPVANRNFKITLFYRKNANEDWETIREQSYTFFTQREVTLHLLDAEDPLTEVGEYLLHVYIEEEVVSNKRFNVALAR